ncbi:putative leader peptide [Nakamurella leprariae]
MFERATQRDLTRTRLAARRHVDLQRVSSALCCR